MSSVSIYGNATKYFVRFYCFLYITSSLSFSQTPYSWIPLTKPTTKTLTSVFFVDSLTGWVGGNNGVVFKTSDGGDSWIQQTSGADSAILEIFMLNSQLGWMLSPKSR
ncbi:MAG: hypothetical protein HYZ34_05905, partial [Ignavibacteriae bacterium]|nr:hypothetical protein [Ignavibacteriota bacterium]